MSLDNVVEVSDRIKKAIPDREPDPTIVNRLEELLECAKQGRLNYLVYAVDVLDEDSEREGLYRTGWLPSHGNKDPSTMQLLMMLGMTTDVQAGISEAMAQVKTYTFGEDK